MNLAPWDTDRLGSPVLVKLVQYVMKMALSMTSLCKKLLPKTSVGLTMGNT